MTVKITGDEGSKSLVIENSWLTFLELAPVLCLFLNVNYFPLAIIVLLFSYVLHFSSKNARYLLGNVAGLKWFLFIICPIIYFLAFAALILPPIPVSPTLAIRSSQVAQLLIMLFMLAARTLMSRKFFRESKAA